MTGVQTCALPICRIRAGGPGRPAGHYVLWWSSSLPSKSCDILDPLGKDEDLLHLKWSCCTLQPHRLSAWPINFEKFRRFRKLDRFQSCRKSRVKLCTYVRAVCMLYMVNGARCIVHTVVVVERRVHSPSIYVTHTWINYVNDSHSRGGETCPQSFQKLFSRTYAV